MTTPKLEDRERVLAAEELIEDLTVKALEIEALREWFESESRKHEITMRSTKDATRRSVEVEKYGFLRFRCHRAELEAVAVEHNRSVFLAKYQELKAKL